MKKYLILFVLFFVIGCQNRKYGSTVYIKTLKVYGTVIQEWTDNKTTVFYIDANGGRNEQTFHNFELMDTAEQQEEKK